MRHRKLSRKLSRTEPERRALLRDLVRGLFIYESIKTTVAKAKEARRLAEKLITVAKKDSLAARRRVYAILQDRDIIGNLFKDIAPRFKQRPGGYTRIIRFNNRRGDGAPLAILELVERKIKEPSKKAKKEKAPKEEIAAKEPATAVEEKPHIVKEEVHKKDVLKEDKTKKRGLAGNLRRLFQRKKMD